MEFRRRPHGRLARRGLAALESATARFDSTSGAQHATLKLELNWEQGRPKLAARFISR
jgi:hypothetical protein